MLTAAKGSLIFLVESCRQMHSKIDLMELMTLITTFPKTLLPIFIKFNVSSKNSHFKIILNYKMSVKSSLDPDDNSY